MDKNNLEEKSPNNELIIIIILSFIGPLLIFFTTNMIVNRGALEKNIRFLATAFDFITSMFGDYYFVLLIFIAVIITSIAIYKSVKFIKKINNNPKKGSSNGDSFIIKIILGMIINIVILIAEIFLLVVNFINIL